MQYNCLNALHKLATNTVIQSVRPEHLSSSSLDFRGMYVQWSDLFFCYAHMALPVTTVHSIQTNAYEEDLIKRITSALDTLTEKNDGFCELPSISPEVSTMQILSRRPI